MKSRLNRFDLALGVGTLLYLVILETRLIARPWVFLVGPFVVMLCFYFLCPTISKAKWWRIFLFAGVVAIVGFLLAGGVSHL
jgi:positive regulator of sigma E activity